MGSSMSMKKDDDAQLRHGDETSKQMQIVQGNLSSQSIVNISITTTRSQSQDGSTLFNCNFQDNSNCTIVVGENNHLAISQKDPLQSGEKLQHSSKESHELSVASEPTFPSFGYQVQICADKEFKALLRKYRDQTNKLHFLRDKGLYEKLEKEMTILEITKEDAERNVFTMVERSISSCHRKEFEKALNFLRKALELIACSSLSTASFLTALCYLYLASLHRREGKPDRAERCIQTALQQLEFVPMCELKALAVYEQGSISVVLAEEKSISDDNGSKLAETAENDLRRSISIYCNLSMHDKTLYIRKHIFALCKIAIRKLKCDSDVERNINISPACFADARKCINTVEEKYGHQIPPAAQIQLHIAKSDYNFRIGKYRKAQRYARSALDEAEFLNMNLELSRIQHRLDAINSCLQSLSDRKDAEFF